MGIRMAVCDDNGADAQYVEALARDWAAQAGEAVQIDCFPSAEAFLFACEETGAPDILLLDVEMPGMDGVTLAKRLRARSEEMQIVFVTGYSDYIAEGYEVAALHYLLKPVKREKLFSVLDRAADRLRKDGKVLTLETAGEVRRVPVRQIRWAEAARNYVTIHAAEPVTVKRTLASLAAELDDRFVQAGRSLLVNVTCIARVNRTEIVLQDGTALPIPRRAYESVNRAIIQMR